MISPGFTLAYLMAGTVAAVAAFFTWRHRAAPGARPLALMIVAASAWAFFDAAELQLTTVAAKRLVSQLQYLAVVSVPPLFLRAALELSRRGRSWTGPLARLAIWGVPAVTLAAAWTSASHGWLWRSVTIPDPSTNLAVYRYGPWFWVHTVHAYLLLAAGTGLLLATSARVRSGFRAPIAAVVVAVLLPWVGNVAYVFKLGPWVGFNWLSVSLVASGGLLAWGAVEGGLFDLLPRAREMLLTELTDAVWVLDRDGETVFANRAAERLLEAGRSRAALLAGMPGSEGSAAAAWSREIALEGSGDTRWYDVRGRAVLDRWGEPAGRILVLRDVTERKELEETRERLIADLEAALERVRTLEGLIPICANCRDVRDDTGFWQRIETYLGDRMPVVFSHALCPDCKEELYPQLRDDPSAGDGHG